MSQFGHSCFVATVGTHSVMCSRLGSLSLLLSYDVVYLPLFYYCRRKALDCDNACKVPLASQAKPCGLFGATKALLIDKRSCSSI